MKKIKFSEDQLVDNTRDHYSLYEAENELFDFYVDYPDQLPYVYYICNPENQLIYTFQSKDDALDMHLMDFQRSDIRKTFIRYVNIDRSENAELETIDFNFEVDDDITEDEAYMTIALLNDAIDMLDDFIVEEV